MSSIDMHQQFLSSTTSHTQFTAIFSNIEALCKHVGFINWKHGCWSSLIETSWIDCELQHYHLITLPFVVQVQYLYAQRASVKSSKHLIRTPSVRNLCVARYVLKVMMGHDQGLIKKLPYLVDTCLLSQNTNLVIPQWRFPIPHQFLAFPLNFIDSTLRWIPSGSGPASSLVF